MDPSTAPPASLDLFDQPPPPPATGDRSVVLAGATDLAGFRQAARQLLDQQVAPAQVSWYTSDDATPDLFAGTTHAPPPEALATCVGADSHRADPSAAHAGQPNGQTAHAAEAAVAAGSAGSAVEAGPGAPVVSVPASFLELCKTVILHRDPGRFGLLYRLLWRLVHEPGLRHDPLDADRVQAAHLAHSVRRDMHKMKAFVRFRTVEDEPFKNSPQLGPLHVAWFEPEHYIVEAVAPFFARRFTQMRWVILTPQCSVRWGVVGPHARHAVSSLPPEGASPTLGRPGGGLGVRSEEPEARVEGAPAAASAGAALRALEFGPGAQKEDAPPADAGEQLWLTYYQHIFNPARLKLKMMQQEMPRRYWKNLPEAQLISALAAQAQQRSAAMVAQAPAAPRRRIPVFEASAAAAARARSSQTLNHQPERAGPLTLPELQQATDRCRECPIGAHATQSVFGEGPSDARLFIVGEQPGDQEDLRGRPFVGPAGQLFDQAVGVLGWQRDALYVTNAVKHFKYELRGKRRIHKTPSQREAAACLHWLDSELAQVQPRVAVALGATAARALLGRPVAVLRERGQWFTRPDGLRVLVTLHPSALLRADPASRAQAFQAWVNDLQQAASLMHAP